MQTPHNIHWQNPNDKIWGFHVHQELDREDFPLALHIQKHCADYLIEHGVLIQADEAIRPGYGPHLNYMWELRIENVSHPLEFLGLAISYMAINRMGLSAYIHALMHNQQLNPIEQLAAEGLENESNILVFSKSVPQNKDFFFNPPQDATNNIVDTRTSRIISPAEKQNFYNQYQQPLNLINPAGHIKGFHIHMDFTDQTSNLALLIFEKFKQYLLAVNVQPSSSGVYGPGENGPHVQAGWEVKFETQDPFILKHIGYAMGWLMCNRQNLSVFMHPITWTQNDVAEELHAHEAYAMFIGEMPALDLGFFKQQIVA